MSTGKGSKRISVFDRLGPGTDESSPTHRRHTSSSGAQEKGRGHAYPPAVPHVRMEDRETPPARDRKARHRASIGDYPPSSSSSDVKGLEEKRTPNPPPLKSTRDPPEVLKSAGVKAGKASGSGESDYESGEDGKRRKGYHGDQDLARSSEGPEDGSSRRGKDKVHTHSERPGSSTGHHRSPPPSDKRSRRDGTSMGHEHKRRREEDIKTTPSELGHKRKRDHFDDGHLHETKRPRHGHDHSNRDRESDYHHGDHHHGSKESEHLYGSTEKKWRQELSGSELSRKQQLGHHSGGGRSSGSERERGRERERSSSKAHRHSSREGRRVGAQEKEYVRASEGRTSRSLDWSIVSDYTERANAKLKYQYPVAVLKKFTPAAMFSSVAVSPSLAGPQRYEAILDLVRAHVKDNGETGVAGHWLEALQLNSGVPTTPQKTTREWDKTISDSLGACRRALTAADDYALRRLLRKGQDGRFISGPVRTAPNSWATSQYEIALNYYNTLATKPSGKPANRLQTSRVGTLVL